MNKEISIIEKLRPYLEAENIHFKVTGDKLNIPLPDNFGELEICDLEEGDDLIGLVGEQWHTHSDLLGEPNIASELKILDFLKGIFSGKHQLVNEKGKNGEDIKSIYRKD